MLSADDRAQLVQSVAAKYRFVVGPSERKPTSDLGIIDTVFTACLSYCHALSVNVQPSASALVVRLVVDGSPAAIVWAIWTIVVDSLQRISIWAWSHIAQELRRVRNPFWTHRYSSTTVILKPNRMRICAALLGCNPSVPFACSRLSVLQVTESALTPATCNSCVQHVGADRFHATTSTTAKPPSVSVRAFSQANYREVSKALSSEIIKRATH